MDTDRDRALFLRYCAGERPQDLADEAGLTRQGLRDRWRAHGWQPPALRQWLLAPEVTTIRAMVANGKTIPEILAATGRQRAVVCAFLRREGLTPAPAPLPPRKADHWRRVLGRILDGETWFAILGPDAVPSDRKRELRGLQRYCAQAGLPVPARAFAHLGPSGPRTVTSCRSALVG